MSWSLLVVPTRLCELVSGKLEISDVDEAYSCSWLDELVAIDILDTKLLGRSGLEGVETRLFWDVFKSISLDVMIWGVTSGFELERLLLVLSETRLELDSPSKVLDAAYSKMVELVSVAEELDSRSVEY